MWIEPTKNGKFKFVERYEDFFTGQVKKVSVTLDKDTNATRKVALQTLNAKIEKALSQAPKKEVTLSQLVDAYREEQKLTVKQSTYRRNYFTANTVIDILGKNVIVDRLTSSFLRDALLKSERTAEQLNELLKRFKGILRWGYTNDLVKDITFLDKIERFNAMPHKEKIQDKFLESDELKTLLSNMKIESWRLITEFLALSGLRFGELAALTDTHVNTTDRIIKVCNNYDYNNDVTTTAKTGSSEREVYIQDELLVVCKKLKSYMLRQQLMYGYERSELFLTDKNGEHIKHPAYNKYLQENAIKCLGRKITPHVLRHTHASLLMENGIDIDTISRRLGHEDSAITKQIYLHVTEKLKEKDNQKIKSLKIM